MRYVRTVVAKDRRDFPKWHQMRSQKSRSNWRWTRSRIMSGEMQPMATWSMDRRRDWRVAPVGPLLYRLAGRETMPVTKTTCSIWTHKDNLHLRWTMWICRRFRVDRIMLRLRMGGFWFKAPMLGTRMASSRLMWCRIGEESKGQWMSWSRPTMSLKRVSLRRWSTFLPSSARSTLSGLASVERTIWRSLWPIIEPARSKRCSDSDGTPK